MYQQLHCTHLSGALFALLMLPSLGEEFDLRTFFFFLSRVIKQAITSRAAVSMMAEVTLIGVRHHEIYRPGPISDESLSSSDGQR